MSKALDTLAGKIARSRLGLEVEWLPTVDTIRERWTIRPKPSSTAPTSGAPVGRALPIASLTTDGLFRFFPDENGRVEILAGIGGPLEAEGGEVGLEIAGREYSVHTSAGEDASKVLNELAGKILRSRLMLEVEYLFTIDTLHEQWTIGSKTETPSV